MAATGVEVVVTGDVVAVVAVTVVDEVAGVDVDDGVVVVPKWVEGVDVAEHAANASPAASVAMTAPVNRGNNVVGRGVQRRGREGRP